MKGTVGFEVLVLEIFMNKMYYLFKTEVLVPYLRFL